MRRSASSGGNCCASSGGSWEPNGFFSRYEQREHRPSSSIDVPVWTSSERVASRLPYTAPQRVQVRVTTWVSSSRRPSRASVKLCCAPAVIA